MPLGILIHLIVKKSKIMADAKGPFSKKFGTFFDEFKQEGCSNWLFYLIFAIRRFSVAILILFIQEPVTQLAFSLTFSISVSAN